MSLQITKTLAWIRVAVVPLFLVISSGMAIWLNLAPRINPEPPASPIPQLRIDLSKFTSPLTIREQKKRDAEINGNPFRPLKKMPPVQVAANLRSINLDLVIVGSRKRLCRVNGQMMEEGDQTDHFLIETIEKNGVWYKTGTEKFYLRTGESILIDNLGHPHTGDSKKTGEHKPE
jgi:hypothetical protein